MRVIGDQVLVRDIEEEYKGLLIIPDTAKQKSMRGEVLSVGPGKRNRSGERMPMAVKPGDKILYSKYVGIDVSKGALQKRIDEDLLVMRESDIFAIIEE